MNTKKHLRNLKKYCEALNIALLFSAASFNTKKYFQSLKKYCAASESAFLVNVACFKALTRKALSDAEGSIQQ